MTTKPNGLSNILAEGTEDYLDPSQHSSHSNGQGSPGKRIRIYSTEQHDDDDDDSHHDDNNNSLPRGISDYEIEDELKSKTTSLGGYDHADFFQTKREKFIWYINIAIEGDLAGFQIAWLLMSVGFLIMKIFGITDVIDEIDWWAIFVIPIMNALLTAWFDYIIRKYRSSRTVESLKKSRFVILWLIKVIMALYVTTYWVWGDGSFMERYENNPDFQVNPQSCKGQIICVYISLMAASCMSEMMITTVLINSEQNLSLTRTPIGYRFILLIIRPFVWVYNRTMVMMLCFYALYGLMYSIFMVGIVCDYWCKSYRCAETQRVGLQMLLVPFTVPEYLTYIDKIFSSWNDIEDKDYLNTFVIVFLCQSFYVDCLNSLWQFSRRYLKPKRTIESQSTMRSGGGSPHSPLGSDVFMTELAKSLPQASLDDAHASHNSQSIQTNNNEIIALKD